MSWHHKYNTKGGFQINQICFKQSFNTSNFTNEQYLSKINRNQPLSKSNNRTTLGNIMERREGNISHKICTQISISYQTRYPISNKFYFLSFRTYCTSFDWTQIDHTITLEKIDWDELLPSDLTKRWKKCLENLPDIQNITLDRWYRLTDTDTELHVFADASKMHMTSQVISDLRLTTNQNAVLSCQNRNLRLSIRSQNRFHISNWKLFWLHHV